MSGTVLIVNGGAAIVQWQRDALARIDQRWVIGVDSGVDRAHDAGLDVDVAVGDFDSVSARGLMKAEESGARSIRHPTVKDRTDLEFAIDLAIEHEPERIVFVAMDGGRSDHALANLLLMSDPRLRPFEVDVLLADATVAVIQERRTITGRVGALVSLVPVGGSCFGVRTSGLEYPLDDETLHPSHGRGLSNSLVAPVAVVEIRTGSLLAFQPRPVALGRGPAHHGATENPAVENAAVENAAVENPSTGSPALVGPATEKPATEKPATENPAVGKTAVENPAGETDATEAGAAEAETAESDTVGSGPG